MGFLFLHDLGFWDGLGVAVGGWLGLWVVVVGWAAVVDWLLLIFLSDLQFRWLVVTVMIGFVVVVGLYLHFLVLRSIQTLENFFLKMFTCKIFYI